MEYSLTQAIELLQYSNDWNVDHETICMDLMAFHQGYIFRWNDELNKFVGTFVQPQ